MQAVFEILLILFVLACVALVASGALDAVRWLRGRPALGLGHWVSLLGEAALLFLVLLLLVLADGLTVAVGP
jgi:hypothetical protein